MKTFNDKIPLLFGPHQSLQAQEFQAYWKYVYKYTVGHVEDFKPPDDPWYKRKEFKEHLEEEGMTIKVSDGY